MPSLPSARLKRRRVAAPLLAFSSMFHLPFSPQRKPIEPLGTTIWPLASSYASVFHSGLLASPSPPSSLARRKWPGTRRPSARRSSRTSSGMSEYWRQ